MESFGQTLKQVMKHHGLRPEDVARATGLDVEHIEALARDDFRALPDDAVVRRALEAFALLVDVDPKEVMADYRQQQRRSARRVDRPPSKPMTARLAGFVIPGLIILAIAVTGLLFWPRSSRQNASRPAEAALDHKPIREKAKQNQEVAAPVKTIELDASPRSATVTAAPTGASRASVSAQGVGTRIVDHNLVGASDQFTEGDRVWYWTRIEGGTNGETIEHVWIHEGVEVNRVQVELGGPHWRTHT